MATEDFALAVIDVGLPGRRTHPGAAASQRGETLPTLILTARCTLNDKVKALDLGRRFPEQAFEPAELAARCGR